jgi:protein-L-isoaspartate O-methyltransferase
VREATVDIGGENYVITSDDDYLEHIRNGFEPEMVKLFRALASGCEVILDVGANIGCTAILFGGLSKNVYAFEPSPTTFAFLEKNILRAGRKNVFLQNIEQVRRLCFKSNTSQCRSHGRENSHSSVG